MPETKSIIDRMGGTAEVFPSPGKGTEVVLRFKFRLARDRNLRRLVAVKSLRMDAENIKELLLPS